MRVVKEGYAPLEIFEHEVIELTVQYPNGHFSVAGRVRVVRGERTNIWVGSCCLPADANVRKGQDSNEFIYHTERETFE